MQYRDYSDEDITAAVRESLSLAEVLRKLGLIPRGGNYHTLKRNIRRLGLDTSHFLGQARNLDQEFKSFEGLTSIGAIRKRLLKERGHGCEACGLSVWQNAPIPLELEHINANRNDNSRENLVLLCPNCHALTPTWRRGSRVLVGAEGLQPSRATKLGIF